MRRLFATLVLLLFVSVPSLKLYCTLSCAQGASDDVSAMGGCPHEHHHDTRAPLIASDNRCCHDVVMAQAVTATGSRELAAAPAVAVDPIVLVSASPRGAVRHSFATQTFSSPPGPFATPLRL